jgi:hypothetical protein
MNPGVVDLSIIHQHLNIIPTPINLNSPDNAVWYCHFFCATHEMPDGIIYGWNVIIVEKKFGYPRAFATYPVGIAERIGVYS